MALVRRSYGYSKLYKQDPEEIIHRRAQFLIYKTLQAADSQNRPSFFRVRLCRLKMKIGKKLKKLRKAMLVTITAAKVRVYGQVVANWKRFSSVSSKLSSALLL